MAVSKERKMLKELMEQMNEGIFEQLCSEGKELCLKAAAMVGVSPEDFAPVEEYYIDLDPGCISFGYEPKPRLGDLEASLVITNKKTGKSYPVKVSISDLYE